LDNYCKLKSEILALAKGIVLKFTYHNLNLHCNSLSEMFDKIQMQTLESTQQSVVVLNELGYAFERYVKAIEYSTQIQSIANILSLRLGYFLSYVNAWLI